MGKGSLQAGDSIKNETSIVWGIRVESSDAAENGTPGCNTMSSERASVARWPETSSLSEQLDIHNLSFQSDENRNNLQSFVEDHLRYSIAPA